MFEVGFNPIYPAEHRIKYCPSASTAPDQPVSAPMELHTWTLKPEKKQNQNLQLVPCKTFAKYY